MAGEETVSHENLCWFTKTHWPANSPLGSKKFKAQKCISVVRNPIDAIVSYCYLKNTLSHSHVSVEKPNEVDPVWWDGFVTKTAEAMSLTSLEINRQVMPTIPTYYVRYEDLSLDPLTTLTELFCFLLEVPSIQGTVVERRIQDYCADGIQNTIVYKLKTAQNISFNRNIDMYT